MEKVCFFFNDTATTEIYTLSLHDALPICIATQSLIERLTRYCPRPATIARTTLGAKLWGTFRCQTYWRSEEHTSELQSQSNLVCRLLLEKKNDVHLGGVASANRRSSNGHH